MIKRIRSPGYNLDFNPKTGFTARWGKTLKDDPKFSPCGPEILDIEVSTICHGINGPCEHCYKSNTNQGKNMNFETFETIIEKFPRTLTQIAFGIGDIDGNPDLFKMFEYCREIGVVPNLTINGARMTNEYYDKLAKLCGAVAVSRYTPKYICYNAVDKLTERGMDQVNIHMLVANETVYDCLELLTDYQSDKRLKKLNAIVFLLLKPKGKRNQLTMLKDRQTYKYLVDEALLSKIPIGFDSCSAPKFLQAVHNDKERFGYYKMISESCESSLFSSYINVDGKYFHCSFVEGLLGWEGIDVVNCDNFLQDVWFGKETMRFRNLLLNQTEQYVHRTLGCEVGDCRLCPVYNLY